MDGSGAIVYLIAEAVLVVVSGMHLVWTGRPTAIQGRGDQRAHGSPIYPWKQKNPRGETGAQARRRQRQE